MDRRARAPFGEAVKRGRIVADSRVARGLYDRAVGYDHKVERSVVIASEIRPVTTAVHYPPNVQACIFWLRNRRRQTWRDAGRDPGRDVLNAADDGIGDIARLEAASESVRHHEGD